MTPKTVASPMGTVVKIMERSGYLIALDPLGREVDDVPAYAMKAAYKDGRALKKQPTQTGGYQWRQKDLSLWNEAKRDESPTEKSTEINVGAVDYVVEEDAMDHKQIVHFLQSCYGLKPTLLKIDEPKWKFAIRAILRGENLLILGDAGTGKTLTAREAARAMNRTMYYFNFGATQDARSTLIGNTHFDPAKGTYVAEALFVKAIQIPNSVILLDELTRGTPDAHNILMTVLDRDQRYLRIDEKADSPTIKVAKGVSFIATANMGAEYTATRTLDRAMKDRFSILQMDWLTMEEEVELLTQKFPALEKSKIQAIAEIATESREQMKSDSPKVDTIVSTRITVEMAGLLYDGFTLAEAAEVCILPFYTDAGGAESPQTYMRQFIQKYIEEPSTAHKKDPFAGGDPNKGAKSPF